MRDRFSQTIVENRRVVIAVVLVGVLLASGGLFFLEESSGLQEFEIGTSEEEKLAYVEANFTGSGEDTEVAQIVVHDDNVFEKGVLVETLELQKEIRRHEAVEPTLREEQSTAGVANAIATAAIEFQQSAEEDETAPGGQPTLDEQIAALESLDQQQINLIVQALFGDSEADQSAERQVSEAIAFMPNEYDPGDTTANSTMLVVFQSIESEYPATAAPPAVVDSHLAIQDLGTESDLETTVIGSGIMTDEEQRALGDTMSLIGPVALFLVILVLVLAYRDLVDVLLGIVGIVLVQLFTFGMLGWLGLDFNVLLIAVPVLLIGLSIDYCIHVFMRYREQRAETGDGVAPAMGAGLAGVGVALVWVTVTTAIGFLSNIVSPVRPIQELGLIAAIGIVGSFIIFVLLLPPLKVEIDSALERFGIDREKPPIGTGSSRVGRLLAVGARGARKAPVAVILAVLLVTALTTVAAANVSTSWGPEENMVEETPGWMENLPESLQPGEYSAKENLALVNEQYVRHGSQGEILVEGAVTDSETLQRVATAEARAGNQRTVQKLANGEPRVQTPLTVIEAVRSEDEAFDEMVAAADVSGDGVPDQRIGDIYDALFELAPNRASEVIHRTDGEYEAIRLSVTVAGDADGGEVTEQLQTVGESLEDDGMTVTVTGEPVVGQLIQQYLLDSLLSSLAITLLAVLVVLAVVFHVTHGSATLGMVTLVPVVFAVSWIIGTMTVLGYPLSVLNAIIASLTIGIGIDYSIHVSERFQQELTSAGDPSEAITRTVRGTGGALLGSAATTAIGFGVLGLAIHPPLQQFGIVTAIMIGYAFLGSVLVLPSLLVLWQRYLGPESSSVGSTDSRAVEASGEEAQATQGSSAETQP